MTTAKKPLKTPIPNLASTGRPQTPSGSGTVHPGRTGPRNGNTARGETNGHTNGKTGDNWWQSKEHDPMTVSAGLHRLADEIWRPDSTPPARSSRTQKTLPPKTNTKAQPSLKKTPRGH